MAYNDQQRTVLGLAAVALILAVMFFVPWRVKSTGEIKWAPIYRQPVSYAQSYADRKPGSRYTYHEAEIAVGMLLVEILGIGLLGGTAYLLSAGGTVKE